MTDEKRKQKLAGKQIKDLGILPPYLVIPTHWCTLKPLVKFLRTVLLDFFLLQYSVKLRLRKIEIIQVGDPLDDKIPYRPDKSDTYLDFIHFWIRPLTLVIKRFGVKRALPHLSRFMSVIQQAYAEAARVYKFKMSTTIRPPHNGNKNMKTIHRVDPHYLCVPSLHIAVVTLTYCFFDDVFQQEHLSPDEHERYTKELYDGAVEIAETVLYVKQHSVNCIPAALYMMLHILPDTFDIEKGVRFINDLFLNAPDVTPNDRQEIAAHVHYMFERLLLEGLNEDDWTIPVKRWLLMRKEQNTKPKQN